MRIEQKYLSIIEAGRTVGNNFYLEGALDRKDYVKVNQILEAVGGKWNKKAKAHIFDIDAADAVDQILSTGEVQLVKELRDQYQFFPTQKPVVDILIEAANIDQPGLLCLEPSAGNGAIVEGLVEAGADFHLYEIQRDKVAELEAKGYTATEADFLNVSPRRIYDRVVMNPPFAKGADAKHVKHALQFLKPGGLLVAVMSAGISFRESKLYKELRDFIYMVGGTIDPLPEGSFKESGTGVNTVVVTIPCLG